MKLNRPAFPALARCGASLLIGTAMLPGAALAQDDAELAPKAQLTVTQQLAVDDGYVIGSTPLDLQLQTGTRSQVLRFDASVPLRLNDPDDEDFFGVGDRQAQLLYRRFVRNSSIEVQGRYREADLDNLIFYDDAVDDIVTLDNGRRADGALRMGYAFGSQSKLGGEFSLGYLDRRYIDTTDDDLNDSVTYDGSATIFLEPTPLIRARVFASGRATDSEDDGTDTRSHRVGAGASMQVNRQVNVDVELAQARVWREELDTGTIEESRGLAFAGTLTYLQPDGEYTLSLSSDPGTEGRRERLSFGRSFERPGYDLTLRGGLTRLEDDDPDPTFEVAYSSDLSRLSSVKLGLRQEAVSDLDGNEAINTSLTSSYSRQLDDRSSVGITLLYRQSEVQRGDDEDARSAALDVSYSHQFSEDIALSAGVNILRSREDDGERDDNERIYLGLGKSFNFLP
ncbi:hypothetical protein Q4511_13565 [Paracoccus sp. 1_MG-2023]|uniref:hypothetical protein n=1 Tax=unclassified Paracoccus (in: a-proteobacteria) TaxID=2688777 RepID=UPI001C09F499|nr:MULTISPECIES: hypothetical protein [unclassified Paracoccus (in: a-proteobacteria)]MBU2958954.1 hypothetical protein [Paracoccus sp. C2R09]MDO6669955.1 hypothetical protein [Paracoccus sp. 1_MG-2023]